LENFHLRRDNILKVVLSLLRAKQDQEWASRITNNKKIKFETSRVIDLLYHHLELYNLENEIIGKIPHLKINYENDIGKGCWDGLSERISSFIGIENKFKFEEVQTIKKTTGKLIDLVENYDKLILQLELNGFSKFYF
jgi:hypothetical protein